MRAYRLPIHHVIQVLIHPSILDFPLAGDKQGQHILPRPGVPAGPGSEEPGRHSGDGPVQAVRSRSPGTPGVGPGPHEDRGGTHQGKLRARGESL